jgi:integration host factor subunit alpha
MSAVTKADLARAVNEKLGLSLRESEELVKSFFEEIAAALIGGKEVRISGLGTFSVRHKKERPGRNPKTGEVVSVEARHVVVFKAGQKFRESIEDQGDKAHN